MNVHRKWFWPESRRIENVEGKTSKSESFSFRQEVMFFPALKEGLLMPGDNFRADSKIYQGICTIIQKGVSLQLFISNKAHPLLPPVPVGANRTVFFVQVK